MADCHTVFLICSVYYYCTQQCLSSDRQTLPSHCHSPSLCIRVSFVVEIDVGTVGMHGSQREVKLKALYLVAKMSWFNDCQDFGHTVLSLSFLLLLLNLCVSLSLCVILYFSSVSFFRCFYCYLTVSLSLCVFLSVFLSLSVVQEVLVLVHIFFFFCEYFPLIVSALSLSHPDAHT